MYRSGSGGLEVSTQKFRVQSLLLEVRGERADQQEVVGQGVRA